MVASVARGCCGALVLLPDVLAPGGADVLAMAPSLALLPDVLALLALASIASAPSAGVSVVLMATL